MISKTNAIHLTALALLASAAAASAPNRETASKASASTKTTSQSVKAAAAAPDAGAPAARMAPVSSRTITGPVDPLKARQVQEDIRRAGDKFGKGTPMQISDDRSVSTPVHESSDSHGAQVRAAARWRQQLRDAVKWEHLDRSAKNALAPYLVADDQIDERGVALVTYAWTFTPAVVSGSNRESRDAILNVEGDLVVVGDRFVPTEGLLVAEVSGTRVAGQAAVQNWQREFALVGSDQPEIWAVATSLYGNAYVCGKIIGPGPNTGRYLLAEFAGSNGDQVGSVVNFPAGGNARADGVVIDPIEDYLYVCGRGGGQFSGGWLARHRPDAAKTRDWIVAMPWGGGGSPTLHDPVKVNRYGEVFVAGYNATQTCLTKFNPVDGSQDWTYIGTDGSFTQAFELDFDGNPYVTSLDDDSQGWITRKFDRKTGAVLWTATETLGNPQDIAVDDSGNVYVCGLGNAPSTSMVRKYNASGTLEWSEQYGTTGFAKRVALDRLGNPYVAGFFGSGGVDLRKFKPQDMNGGAGAQQVWATTHTPKFNAAETAQTVDPIGLDIDANGSIYVSGPRQALPSGGGNFGTEYFVIKWEQPFEFIPQIKRSNPTVRMEKRSLWSPTLQDDLNNALPGLSNLDFTLFSFPMQPIVDIVNYATYLQVSYGLQGNGLTQGGIRFGFNTPSASLGVGFQSEITGGTFDASAKGELVTVAPADGGTSGLSVGDPIPLTFDWTPSAKQLELIANNTPRLTAAIVSKAVGDMNITARAHDTTLGTILGDTAVLSGTNLSRLNNKPIISVDTNQLLEDLYDWYDYRSGSYPQSEFANAQFRLPRLRPSSSFDASTALLKSTISEKFVKGRVNVTNIISFYATGGFVPSVTYYDDSCCHTIDFYVGILQAYFRGDIAAEQDLTLELRPYVKLATDQNGTIITIPLLRTGTPGNYTYTASYSNANLTLPSDGNIQITPTFGMKGVLTNRTGLRMGLYAGFEPVDIDINARAAGIDLANIDQCLGCIEQDLIALVPGNSRVSSALNGGKINLFNQTFPEFTFPNEVVQSTFTVTGDVNNQPQLSGFSRAFAPMIIYNQRNPPTPNQFSFGFAPGNAAGNVPMIAYGAKFTSTTPNLTVRISHQGRNATLSYTRLNDNSLLVELPRYYLVVPGVAQIWVTNNNGSSKAIDFPIVYPTPNFAGLSSTVWAGDPRWAGDGETIGDGLIAVDGGSPGGYDTWIARRDYYKYLRQSIWNGSVAVFSIFNVPVNQIFPAFAGWELGATKSPPDFPTLVALNGPGDDDDVPLSLFRQASPLPEFNNDGFFRSNLQQNLHTQAGFLDFVVVNPGPYPGGGESRIRTIEIPAPKPVISEIFPPSVKPGSVPAGQFLRLDVRGPDSVPFFNGYENAKFGNFTSDSVVRIGNLDCTTEFINPGYLVALIPANQLNAFSDKIITVRTPANSTKYAEERRDGNNNIVFTGNVNSGGTSDPIVLEVLWPAPVINGVGQSILTVNTPPTTPILVNGVPSDNHNFSITGNNFAPGCIVTWNGVSIPFTRVSDTEIRTTINAAQISTTGTRRLEVSNPAPNARTSNAFIITVVN
ncbi:MAG: SBBP repeat-containing protein [Phycisphaerales bacterium]